MGLKLVMIRFSIIAPMTNTREQTKGLMMCLILNWNVFASCLMMWLINLLRRSLVEFKKTRIGDNCCVLTNDNNLKEVLKNQTILIIEGDLL